MSAPASNMFDEKLIECVRKYEFLYNLQHPKSMDLPKKELAWKEISEQLKQPAATCKRRWQLLRDAFRRALNKRKGKNEQQLKYAKKWKYDDEMSFVAPYYLERKTDLASEEEDTTNNYESIKIQNSTCDSWMNSNDAVDVAASKMDTEIQNVDKPIVCNKSSQTKRSKTKKRANVEAVQSASALLMAKLFDEQKKLPQQPEHDELDRFFLSISDTVKKFSPYLQVVAKHKIFNLVSEMELQQIAPSSLTTSTHNEVSNAYASPLATSSSVQPSAPSRENWDTSANNWNAQSKHVFE